MLLPVLGATTASHAHLAVSRRSLRMLIVEADLVIHARLVQVDEVVVAEGHEGSSRRPASSAEILEVIKGPAVAGETILFAQHGHGVAQYQRGDHALLFLRDLSRSRELRDLRAAGALRWYSDQEHDDDYVLDPQLRSATLAAARRYAAIEEMLPDQRNRALRRITVELLASREPRLARSALRDLALSTDSELVTERDVPSLVGVVDDAKTPIEVRVGLLAVLERRGWLDGGKRWARLLRTTRGPDRLAVIPAAGAHPSPEVHAELVAILAESDVATRVAAAVALGSPGNDAAVRPLSRALASEDPRLAMAAIRGLGRVGSEQAREVLRSAAASHPDPGVRRRAQAEIHLLEPTPP